MRAYLRLDPSLPDHKDKYPDGALSAFILVLCFAEQQPNRGRFKSEKLLRAHLLQRSRWIPFLIAHQDLLRLPSGELYVEGWDEWQEGDWKVAERVTRIRNRSKRNGALPDSVTVGVTVDVTAPPVNTPSERIAVSGRHTAVGTKREAVTKVPFVNGLSLAETPEMTQEQLDVAIVLEECLGHQLSAIDLQACSVWLTEFRYMDGAAIIDRMRSHVIWCSDTNRHKPKTAAGFHETLRLENDHLADAGITPQRSPQTSQFSKIGDVLNQTH